MEAQCHFCCSTRKHISLCHTKKNSLRRKKRILLRHKERFVFASQEDLSSCATTGNVFWWCRTRCRPGTQEEVASHVSRRHLFLRRERKCLLVTRQISSGDTRRASSLCRKEKLLLATQDEISVCVTRRHIFLRHEKTLSSCVTRSDVFLCYKTRCLPVSQEEISPCDTRRSLFLWREKICPYATRRYFI